MSRDHLQGYNRTRLRKLPTTPFGLNAYLCNYLLNADCFHFSGRGELLSQKNRASNVRLFYQLHAPKIAP